jgi:hypothetical protein
VTSSRITQVLVGRAAPTEANRLSLTSQQRALHRLVDSAVTTAAHAEARHELDGGLRALLGDLTGVRHKRAARTARTRVRRRWQPRTPPSEPTPSNART